MSCSTKDTSPRDFSIMTLFSSHLAISTHYYRILFFLGITNHCCCFQIFDIRIQWKVKLADQKKMQGSKILLTTKNSNFRNSNFFNPMNVVPRSSDITNSSNFIQQVSTNSQWPRTDLDKGFLPRPKTITAWKLIPHRF